ncbi:MAG TPA: SusC/RagA family TonB-linked outer membrane protein, partial [Saprospiraceae bacterium]|nr:SusC/RagA family TonB-linked outer membrane protein [Saprospiraceae bacterium]
QRIWLALFFVAGMMFSMNAQDLEITGKVTNMNGEPMIGATIVVVGTNNATVADINGGYNLKVPKAGGTVQVSYVGMATIEKAVTQAGIYNFEMEESGVALSEIVVTALGIKREEKALGYSVQKVSGDNVQKVATVDVATALSGKVSGLLVRNSSDFAAVPIVTIRGENPLIVIDGVAYANKTLGDIAPADIDEISILKGATASALYGYRGDNGAILITTKNGRSNRSGITVDYSSNTMFTAGFLAIPEKQTVYGRGDNGAYNINSDKSWGSVMDGRMLNQWDPVALEFREYEYTARGVDNFANFLEQGYITTNNLNIGFNKGDFSLRNSFNWMQNKGQYPNSTLNKYTYTLGSDYKANRLSISSNFSYAKKASPNIGTNGYTSYDPMYTLLIWSSPDFDIRDYKDNYWITRGVQQNYIYGIQPNGTYTGASQNNPYFDRYEKTNEIARDIVNADFTFGYDIAKWMKATVRSGLDFYNENGTLRISKGSYLSSGNTAVPGNLYTWQGTKDGAFVIGQNSGFSINSDLLLSGDASFGDFGIEYLAGGTVFFTKDNNMFARTDGGISVPGFFSLKASVNTAQVTSSLFRRQVNSLYGRLGLSWRKLIYVEATGRNDWSSTLPASNRAYFYPSISSSFVLSELLPGTSGWLDLLKWRNSWTVSKTPAAIYAINSSYTLNNATWNTMNGAAPPSSLYGDNILPASAETFETGIQAMLFKNRVMFDVSYYTKRFFDVLKSAPVSPASGYSSNYINIDEEITRKGYEVTLGFTPVKQKDLQWDLGFNWSTYKRYYTAIDSVYSAKNPWVAEGERVDAFIRKDFLKSPDGQFIFNNGRLVTSAYNTVAGYSDPDWLWGLNTNLRYKNISLFVSFDGVVGGLMNSRTESYLWQSGNHPESLTDERALDAATAGSKNFLGEGVKVVSGTVTYDAYGNILTDTREFAPNDIKSTYQQYVIDLHNSSAWGSNSTYADTYSKTYFKLREISMTYDFPRSMFGGIANGASISFVGQNVLLVAKDFRYSDPDGGSEDFSDPAVRYLGFNLKVSF